MRSLIALLSFFFVGSLNVHSQLMPYVSGAKYIVVDVQELFRIEADLLTDSIWLYHYSTDDTIIQNGDDLVMIRVLKYDRDSVFVSSNLSDSLLHFVSVAFNWSLSDGQDSISFGSRLRLELYLKDDTWLYNGYYPPTWSCSSSAISALREFLYHNHLLKN